MSKYGYIRVSTKEQNLDRQYEALLQQGVCKQQIYADQMSGKDFNRPNYKRMLKNLRAGDVLVIKSIDRLGRNYGEIIEQWRMICKVKQVDIEVIDMPLLNTNQQREGLTGVFISDLVLQILAYVSETERSFIRQRQAEGIAIAKAKGTQFGRSKMEIPTGFEHYYELWKKGEISSRSAADALQMSHTTFYRRCREKDQEKTKETLEERNFTICAEK